MGIAVEKTSTYKKLEIPPKCAQVVRNLALDLQQTLTRKGRAPFVLSGLPMFDDLCTIQQTLEQCLSIRDDPHSRCCRNVLAEMLPHYQSSDDKSEQAIHWIDGIEKLLNAPLPTDNDPGPSSEEATRPPHFNSY